MEDNGTGNNVQPIPDNKPDNKPDSKPDKTVSNDTVRRTDVQQVVEHWNVLEKFGIKTVSRVTSGTKRYNSLIARIKQYGIDDVLSAIDRIKQSDFLQGRNSKGWTITFDWFVLPNNFIKVLEGNYDNSPKKLPNVSDSGYGECIDRFLRESGGSVQ